MRRLNQAELNQIAGGNLNEVNCECWKVMGLMGFLAFYGDITEEYALAQVDLVCSEKEQEIAMQLAKLYY